MFYILTKIFIGADMRTFDQVNSKFKEAVKTHLAAIGLDENGNPV